MGYVLAAICVIGGTYLGFFFGGKYVKRECLFRDTVLFLEGLKSQIGFLKKPLAEIILSALSIYESGFYDLLRGYYSLLLGGEPATMENVKKRMPGALLKPEEAQLYAQMFESLGKSDCNYQLQTIEEFKNSFDKLHTLSLAEKNKFSAVYKKVGVLCGAGLAVIFI